MPKLTISSAKKISMNQSLTQPDPFERHRAFRDAMHGQIPPQLLELALTDDFDPTRLLALRFAGQVEFTPAQKVRAMTDYADKVRAAAIQCFGHELPPEEHAKTLFDSSDLVRCNAVLVQPLTDRQRIAMLADPSSAVRAQVVSLGHLTPAQHDEALVDPDWMVRARAVELGGLTKSQLNRAMLDESRQVREAAEAQGGKKTIRGSLRDLLYRARNAGLA